MQWSHYQPTKCPDKQNDTEGDRVRLGFLTLLHKFLTKMLRRRIISGWQKAKKSATRRLR